MQIERPVIVGATLIVCPLSILQQWQDEIATHAPALHVVAYEGSANLTESDRFVKAFKAADIVLTTYNTLQRDLSLHRVNASPLLGVHWWRIMIDEAQARVRCQLHQSRRTDGAQHRIRGRRCGRQ